MVVNKFGALGLKNIEEKNSEKNKIKNDLNNIKLKGIFERYRLNLIKSIEDELSIDLKDKLIEGAEIWKKPEPEKNYIIIGNTHGNASISFVLKTERKKTAMVFSGKPVVLKFSFNLKT